jgi:hypothetical protein
MDEFYIQNSLQFIPLIRKQINRFFPGHFVIAGGLNKKKTPLRPFGLVKEEIR